MANSYYHNRNRNGGRGYYQADNIQEMKEFYPLGINTILEPEVRDYIMSYISPHVNLDVNFDELLPRGQPASAIIDPSATLIGGVDITMFRDIATTHKYVGPVYILISITTNLNNEITTFTIEIRATKINDEVFDGEYFIRVISTTSRGLPPMTTSTDTLHYKNGILDGVHRILRQECDTIIENVDKIYNNGVLERTIINYSSRGASTPTNPNIYTGQPSRQSNAEWFDASPLVSPFLSPQEEKSYPMIYSQGSMYPISRSRSGSISGSELGTREMFPPTLTRFQYGEPTQHVVTGRAEVFNPEELEEGREYSVTRMPSYSRPLTEGMERISLSDIKPVEYQSIVKQPNQYGEPYESVPSLYREEK